jgi:hypothetical protein
LKESIAFKISFGISSVPSSISDHRSLDDLCTSTYTMSQKLCTLYVRCALSVLHKECGKVWGARYTYGAPYKPENAVLMFGRCAFYQSTHSLDWAHPNHGCSKRSLTFMNKWDVSLNVCLYHPKGKNTLPQWELN